VLLFVVFAGGVGPLSGNTVQTRFVNESVKLFAGAFADFAVLRTADVSEQPFDMEFSLKTKGGGLTTATEFEMAYDRLNLGASVDAGIVRMKMLMLEDKLYVDSGFGVAGVQLESDTDLTKPMGLKQRLAALSGSENEVDTIKLVEAFVNSISEDCFRQTGNAFVLQLSATDLQKTLKAFANRLDDDPKLRDDMESLLNGMDIADMEQVLENAASALDVTEFDLTIMIGYRGGAPTAFDIEIESAGSSVEMDFGYEKKGDATIITMGVGEGGDVAEIELTVRRIPSGLELVGSVEADDALFDIKGSIEKAGNTLSGSFDLSDGLEVGTLAFEYTVKPGMPRKAVQDDRRFAIDTENVTMQNIGDLLDFSLPAMDIIENW